MFSIFKKINKWINHHRHDHDDDHAGPTPTPIALPDSVDGQDLEELKRCRGNVGREVGRGDLGVVLREITPARTAASVLGSYVEVHLC